MQDLIFFSIIIAVTVGAVLLIKSIIEGSKKAKIELQESGLVISKIIKAGVSIFYIDNENKRWGFKQYLFTPLAIYNFADILDFEVCEDGENILQSKMGGAIVGGLAFGIVGALVGASGKRKTSDTCTDLTLRITVNSLDTPQIKLSFIHSPTPKSSMLYKLKMDELKNLTSTLAYMQNNK